MGATVGISMSLPFDICDEDTSVVAESTDPQAWAKVMLNSLSLHHDADEADVVAFLELFAQRIREDEAGRCSEEQGMSDALAGGEE